MGLGAFSSRISSIMFFMSMLFTIDILEFEILRSIILDAMSSMLNPSRLSGFTSAATSTPTFERVFTRLFTAFSSAISTTGLYRLQHAQYVPYRRPSLCRKVYVVTYYVYVVYRR